LNHLAEEEIMTNASHPSRTIRFAALAASLYSCLGSTFAADRHVESRDERFDSISQSHGSLVGTWRVQVTTFNCNTGAENPPFASLLTFAAHGTLTGTTANPIFLAGQRSGDHGVWQHLGKNYYAANTEAFIEFSSAAATGRPSLVRGSQQIEQSIELTGPDNFTSDATLIFLDASGTVVGTGCARAGATRLR
jgi:hypothetical protein